MINSMQISVIKKDIRSVVVNKNILLMLILVPFVMTVVIPSVFILLVNLVAIDSPNFQSLLKLLPVNNQSGNIRELLTDIIINNVVPIFFLIIPVMASTVLAASSFIGEKEKKTLETILYCPLSLKQIFSAKILASFLISQIISIISLIVMIVVVQVESLVITKSFISFGLNWVILIILASPAISLIAITLIVRGSAKAKSMEEAQQKGSLLVLPIVLIAVSQFTGVLMVNSLLLFVMGIVFAVIGFILLKGSSTSFTYESLLQ